MTEEPRPKTTVRADSSADEALDVQTVVVADRGQWAVEVVVVFADGVVRKRINTHRTKTRADLAADLIRRAAERDIGLPLKQRGLPPEQGPPPNQGLPPNQGES